MAREKRTKPKIKRRSAGLVITPPAPRPVAADHPARLLFRDAIESTKTTAKEPTKDVSANLPESVSKTVLNDSVKVGESERSEAEPLLIFKELKGTPATRPEDAQPTSQLRRSRSVAFEEHFGQWRPFLTEGEICVLEALFNMTHALGSDHCLTSMPRIAVAAGISERQTYNVVKGLEKYGFIERPETFNTATKKGTIFRLHLTRLTHPGADRRYHHED